MAIYKNRTGDYNYFKIFRLTSSFIYKRFATFLLLILSILLLYLAPIKFLSDISLEMNGITINAVSYCYDVILTPINFLSKKIALLSDLEGENITLKNKLLAIQSIQNKYDLLKAENKVLRNALNIIPDKEYNAAKARLLSISLNPFSKTILIGAGTSHGIGIDRVVASEDGLIGRVVQISANYAKVMLINDINSRIPIITSITGERAILTGENNKLTLLYLQDNHKIIQGEIILTSGDGKIYPYGLPVGKIIGVNSNGIEIEPIVELSKVEFVNILY
jgi:rod shape-determining protein MreC